MVDYADNLLICSGSSAGSLMEAGVFWSLLMIVSFLFQAADTVLKVHTFPFVYSLPFNKVLRFYHLHDCSIIYLEDSFSLYAGSNISGCC